MGENFLWNYKKQKSNLEEGGIVRAAGDEEARLERSTELADRNKEQIELNKEAGEKEKKFLRLFIRENGVSPALLKQDEKWQTRLKNNAPWFRYHRLNILLDEIESENRLRRTQSGK